MVGVSWAYWKSSIKAFVSIISLFFILSSHSKRGSYPKVSTDWKLLGYLMGISFCRLCSLLPPLMLSEIAALSLANLSWIFERLGIFRPGLPLGTLTKNFTFCSLPVSDRFFLLRVGGFRGWKKSSHFTSCLLDYGLTSKSSFLFNYNDSF